MRNFQGAHLIYAVEMKLSTIEVIWKIGQFERKTLDWHVIFNIVGLWKEALFVG